MEATHRADILAMAVINDGASYKARLAAARAQAMAKNGPMQNVYTNAQFSHALYLCTMESKRPIYEGMTFSLTVLHDAAAQVVDYMQVHVEEGD